MQHIVINNGTVVKKGAIYSKKQNAFRKDSDGHCEKATDVPDMETVPTKIKTRPPRLTPPQFTIKALCGIFFNLF
jgi:hypothetical protein